MDFYTRLISLIEKKNYTQTAVADAIDSRKQIFPEWKKNGNLPNGEMSVKLARVLGVSVDYLLTGEQHKDEIPFEDAEILEKYHSLSDANKEFVLSTLNMLWAKEKK